MWKKNLKEVLPGKPKIVANTLLSQHGEVVDDLAAIADIFNEHFSTVGERLVSNATPRGLVDDSIQLTRINSLEEKCTLPDITEEYVQKQISAMSVGKATGPDGISVNMLQIASRYIIKSLTHVFNLSIRGEHYPKDWKYALVTPIHKGGDKCNTTNYRPISILPIISKILERWVHSVVYSYLDECNLIPCCHSGFRPLHSTETTLHDLTNTCYQAMERGEMTGTVFFIDLSKAFDSVNHDVILDKLEKSNMSTLVVNWFKSYLYERSQSVTVGENISKSLPLNTGVPQGSILGPLLFIIYTSDLPSS